jgi:hypothetical protein
VDKPKMTIFAGGKSLKVMTTRLPDLSKSVAVKT